MIGFIGSFIFYIAKISSTELIQTVFTMWFNLFFTAILVSLFVILYQQSIFREMTNGLRYYGRMSLTNYISQSVIGSIIFFPYAFGLAKDLNIAWSLVIGIGVMLLQIRFCIWWLKTHKQGPLEKIWKQGTWLRSNKESKTQVVGDYGRIG